VVRGVGKLDGERGFLALPIGLALDSSLERERFHNRKSASMDTPFSKRSPNLSL